MKLLTAGEMLSTRRAITTCTKGASGGRSRKDRFARATDRKKDIVGETPNPAETSQSAVWISFAIWCSLRFGTLLWHLARKSL